MKKFLSIFIALLLVCSLFATTAVAFAEEDVTTPSDSETETPSTDDETEEPTPEPRKDIIVHEDKLLEYLALDDWFLNQKFEMKNTKFGEKLMEDGVKIREVFENIQYVTEGEDDYDDKKGDNDKIYVEYCRPSESPKGQETWQNSTLITNSINLSSSGWWLFRLVVKGQDDKVLATSAKIERYAEDTTHPVVSLSTSMKDKQTSGLTVGTTYTVSTSLTIDDSSSTTVTYLLYKMIDGQWTQIYDSKTQEIAEGYESNVSSSGVITPVASDVNSSKDPVYKIAYSVVDANGFYGVESEGSLEKAVTELFLFVNEAPADSKKSAVSVWTIVLYCIAGAAAIGILVVALVKPKQPVKETPAENKVETDVSDKE